MSFEAVKDWIAPKPRTVTMAVVVVFALSLAAFLWDIDTPNVMMFDETWYVPTAQKWLAAGEMMHEEHPPLAKLLIALGMWLFGDNPFGWRAMSAGFSALAVSATFLWAPMALTPFSGEAASLITFDANGRDANPS